MKEFKICVVGAGHVGLVAAACFAKMGHFVFCVDNNKKRINDLNKKILPFYEPDLQELVEKGIKSKKLNFSSDLALAVKKTEIIFIAVGTPPNEDGSADLTAIENVAQTVAKNLNGYKLIVGKSTVPVHTGQKIKETILRYKKNGENFDVASNPEFLREGKAIYDFFYPDRIVLGVETKKAAKILKEVHSTIKTKVVVTDINTAELIKHASNSFLSMKISYINAISRICDLARADVEKVAQAIGLDKRIGKDFLNAGVGYGGFCFPKDVEAFIYIADKLGYNFNLLKEVKNVNDSQKIWFCEKIKETLWVLKGKKIAVLGLSFKPDTDDMRFAPSIDIINYFLKQKALVSVYDPQAMKEAKEFLTDDNIKFCKDAYSAAKSADCICFLTEWDEFKNIDFEKIKKNVNYPLVADGRNIFDRKELVQKGFDYIGIGK